MAEFELEGFERQEGAGFSAFALIAIAVAAAFSIVFYVLGATRASALSTLERRVDDLNKKIAEFKDLEGQARSLTKGLKGFDEIVASQVNWKAFWQSFALTQIKTVYYTNMTMDSKGSVRVDGVSPNLEALGKQVKAVEQSSAFSDVVVIQVSKESDKVRFSLSFIFDKTNLKAAK